MINLTLDKDNIALKTALILLLASNPSISNYKKYTKKIEEIFENSYGMGNPNSLWDTLGLTKEQALEYFSSVLADSTAEWAKKHNCLENEVKEKDVVPAKPVIMDASDYFSSTSNRGGYVSLIKGAENIPT